MGPAGCPRHDFGCGRFLPLLVLVLAAGSCGLDPGNGAASVARALATTCNAGTKLADTCTGVLTYAGCCSGTRLIWCGNAEGDTGPLCGLDCISNATEAGKVCGWSSSGWYDCGGSGADPSGTNPLECTGWSCTSNCTGKQCGPDGCLGTCGTCTAGHYCDAGGACQACTCAGRTCGADPCGNPCGTCPAGKGCDSTGNCVAIPTECVAKATAGCPGCACEACVCNGNGSFGGDAACCSTAWDSACAGDCGAYCGGPTCPCVPACAGKTCGPDGCGGTCGTCGGVGQVCNGAGTCCVPDCSGKACGSDGCGGTCGTCAAGRYCNAGQQCAACSCGDRDCGQDQCATACGANSGSCPANEYCDATQHCQTCSCTGRECGGDGCGNGCGVCGAGKGCSSAGKCVDAPSGCTATGVKGCPGCACEACVCVLDDYCCTTAWDNVCVGSCSSNCGANCPCVQQCSGKTCGTDGCGGTCGTCSAGSFCNAGVCTACTCTGKQCGDDGCGTGCGTCPAGKVCGQDDQCGPDACGGITYEGCCEGTVLKYCDNGTLQSGDCGAATPPSTCGWSTSGYYDCGNTGADPSGTYPIACAACTPDCTGKACGDDGCGGSCGTCGTCTVCDANGQCIASPAGARCGLCKACNGAGACSLPPVDDASCPSTFNCDGLDSLCRHYHAVTLSGARCAGLGLCKGVPGVCTDFTDAEFGTSCGNAWCQGSVLNRADMCGVGVTSGGCNDGGSQDCAPYNCSANACLAKCLAPGDCASGAYCDAAGKCQGKKAEGVPCAGADQCQKGFCVDGVCCNTSCSGVCASCVIEGNVGTCKPVLAGTDPQGECSTAGTCGGTCNGMGACTAATPGQPCGTCRTCNGSGQCVPSADGTSCEGAWFCLKGETCLGGQCAGGGATDCSDGNPCTSDGCDETVKQCTRVPVGDGTSCSDGNACNGVETCVGGACLSGSPVDCEDGNPCTTDRCDPVAGGCNHAPATDGLSCADGDACNGGEVCKAGKCLAGTPPACDDGNSCTVDSCDKALGCVSQPVANGSGCLDDGNPCTADLCASGHCTHPTLDEGSLCNTALNCLATCVGGACLGGVTCDDGNLCTRDTCEASGCVHVADKDGRACPDGDVCNGDETCQAGQCKAGPPPPCDDGNPCSQDSCDPAQGCLHANVAENSPCSSATACGGRCQSGQCVGGAAVNCDDGNACTGDSCDPATSACLHAAHVDGVACNDGDACTTGTSCSNGLCGGGKPLDCNDGNPCTDDSCDPTSGCLHGANAASCDDGDPCTSTDTCKAGVCAGVPNRSCQGDPGQADVSGDADEDRPETVPPIDLASGKEDLGNPAPTPDSVSTDAGSSGGCAAQANPSFPFGLAVLLLGVARRGFSVPGKSRRREA